MLYYLRTFFLSDGKKEFTERAAAFFNELEQANAEENLVVNNKDNSVYLSELSVW